MKTKNRYLALALVGGACVLSVQGEKVAFEELAPELRDKIKAHSGANRIEDIDRQTQAGKTIYEVAFKDNGQHKELLFNREGQLLNAEGKPIQGSGKVAYSELPEAVKRIVATRTQGAQVNDVDRQVKDGKVTYEVGFKQNNKQYELLVADDGRILRDVAVPAAPPAQIGSSGARTANLSPEPARLSGTQKIEMSAVPFVPARAINSAAAGARIEDIERGTWQGQTVYQAAFKDGGKHIELQVNEKGQIVHDPRRTASATGAPATAASGRESGTSDYPNVTSRVPLSATQKVDRRSVPGAVIRTFNQQAPGANVEDIERGGWDGRSVYEFAFKHNGEHVELQIDENGKVVYDPRK